MRILAEYGVIDDMVDIGDVRVVNILRDNCCSAMLKLREEFFQVDLSIQL